MSIQFQVPPKTPKTYPIDRRELCVEAFRFIPKRAENCFYRKDENLDKVIKSRSDG